MKFIEIIDLSGQLHHVNAEHIVTVFDYKECTEIELSNGKTISTKNRYEVLIKLINPDE